jgi:rhodanese-related sulfurtransferase
MEQFLEQLANHFSRHPWLVGGAILAVLLVAAYEIRVRQRNFAAVSPQDAIRLMNQGALVLDIRKPDEFAAGHINGARHMPSDQILTAGESMKKYKEKPLLVYCDSGSLGGSAARQLAEQGFTKAFTIRGGLSAWRAESLPVTKR